MADRKLPVNCRKCRDHLGREYRSIRDMTRAWNVGYEAYLTRRKSGWSLERALTEPVRGMCRCRFPGPAGAGLTDPYELSVATGVAPHTIYKRVRAGKSPAEIEFAGNLKWIPSRDHTGRDFPTLMKMAEYWQIEYQTLLMRLKRGWTVEKSLTAPLDRRGRKRGGKNVHAA